MMKKYARQTLSLGLCSRGSFKTAINFNLNCDVLKYSNKYIQSVPGGNVNMSIFWVAIILDILSKKKKIVYVHVSHSEQFPR
jgi:hypothetical protein